MSSQKIVIHDVRNVAPKKQMLCLQFQLPREIAEAAIAQDSGSSKPSGPSESIEDGAGKRAAASSPGAEAPAKRDKALN